MTDTSAKEDALRQRKRRNKQNFLQPGIVRLLLHFVGAGEWLYMATVCKDWQRSYEAVVDRQVVGTTREGCKKIILCTCRMTLSAAVCASGARLQAAQQEGFGRAVQGGIGFTVGFFASTASLLQACNLQLTLSHDVVRGAAMSGDLSKLQWLCIEQNCTLPGDIAPFAAAGGNLDMLQLIRQSIWMYDREACNFAAQAGHVHILECLRSEITYLGCFDIASEAAAKAGQLAALQWLHAHKCHWNTQSVLQAAAAGGNLSMMVWLEDHNAALDATTFCIAAKHGHLEVCKYLRAKGCAWCKEVCASAAENGNFELLQWLHEAGCPFDAEAIIYSAAAAPGGTACLQYVIEQGVTGAQLTKMLNAAGANGRLETAKWLRREHSAPWPRGLSHWPSDMSTWAKREQRRSKAQAAAV